MVLWDLLDFYSFLFFIFFEEVELVVEIMKCFCIGGMFLGLLLWEVYEILVIVMNWIGGKFNFGEGGEDFIRFKILNDVDD